MTTDTIPGQTDSVGEILGNSRAERKYKQKLSSWASDEYTKMKAGRSRTELQWYLDLAFFFGRQNVLPFDMGRSVPGGASVFAGRLFAPPAPYYRVRMVINKIRPAIRKEMAKLTSQKPSISVVPASSEDQDIFAANVGEQIWDYTYRSKEVDVVLERVLFWSSVTGNGYFKCWWDATKQVERDIQGDVSFMAETPFHVFVPDLRETELENEPYLIHAQTRSPEYIQSKFGATLSGPVNYNVNAASDILDDSFVNLIGAQDLDRQRSVLVKEVWVRPGALPSLMPEGGQFTVVGDQVVQGGIGWPYAHGKYPFAKIGAIPSGKFYHDSVIVDLIPVQREINRTHSQIIEAKNRMAKPGWSAPKGSIDPSKVTSEPGLVIEHEPGLDPPKQIDLKPLPGYVQDELERLYTDYDDISGQHEISKGSTPAGVTAGTAIAFLQEQDDSTLSAYFTSMEKGIQKIAHLTLSYVQEYWDEPRTIKVVGTDSSFDAQTFKGSDLRNNTDAHVESGSALPTSKAAKQAFLFDLMKLGAIDPETMFEHMDLAGLNKLYERVLLDIREAQRENLKMARVTEQDFAQFAQLQQQQSQSPEQLEMPLIVPVNEWNNDPIHMRKHDDYRKSQAFELLPQLNKNLFAAHQEKHKLGMSMKLAEQQFLQPAPQETSAENQAVQEQIGTEAIPTETGVPVEGGTF